MCECMSFPQESDKALLACLLICLFKRCVSRVIFKCRHFLQASLVAIVVLDAEEFGRWVKRKLSIQDVTMPQLCARPVSSERDVGVH